MGNLLTFIKKRKVWIIVGAVILVAVVVGIKIRSNGTVETVSPVLGDLVRTVKISGKVVPEESVDLGFETSGTVSVINKQVGDEVRRGDLLVRIDTSGISSNILKAEAELALAQAELDKLDNAGKYENQIDNAKRALIQTMIDTYNTAEDATYKKTDQLFLYPRTNRPVLSPTINGHNDLRDSIIRQRITMGETLDSWKLLVTGLNTSTYTEAKLSASEKYLAQVTSYISDVTFAVNTLEESSSLSQTTIDTYRDDAVSARDNLNSASQSLITAEDNLRGFLLEVPAQVARVEAARASLLNYRSQLAKSSLTSPISGLVSRQDAKAGQVVSSASNVVSVISKELKIEAFIPEVLIAGVKVGDPASTTLDAYGDDKIFEAKVTSVDPAETIRDGVSTYKVELSFTQTSDLVRSGMTANINIETFRKARAILIPERTIVKVDGQTFVYVLLDNGNQEKTAVTIGEKDSQGNVELITKLPAETNLVLDPSGN